MKGLTDLIDWLTTVDGGVLVWFLFYVTFSS